MWPATLPVRTQTLVHLDWVGELRWRAEAWGGVRTNADNALLPTRLDLRHGNADKPGPPADGRLLGTDLRLRLEPTISVGDWSALRMQIDAAGLWSNLGDTTVLRDRLAAGAIGSGPLDSSLGVRRLWWKARLVGLCDLEVGRMPDQFGLGMVRNQGGGLDQDHQSDVDRVKLSAELFGIRAGLARANLASLPLVTDDSALGNYNNAVGGNWGGSTAVPFTVRTGSTGLPLQDSADVIRWDFEVGGGHIVGGRGWTWDIALLWQSQDFALVSETQAINEPVSPIDKLQDPNCGANCGMLSHRGLRTYTFQGALDWQSVAAGHPLRLQLEGAFVYGDIARTDITSAADGKTIAAGGAAARATWQRGRQAWKIDVGVASGETEGGFGARDQTAFKVGGLPDGAPRGLLTGFRFHKSFRLDSVLFRDVVGAVANAWYARPALRHTWDLGAGYGLSAEIGALGAAAMFAAATPGKGRWLGLEPDLALAVSSGSSQAQLRGSVLAPGGAFANAAGIAADPSWRVDAIWQVKF
ncbi:MAG: hypothetical protein FJ100_09570 [Deltaproteobacteria bacterium]|nr:hypothetical protein [Deltaproteobacteria bacterium]